MRGGEEIVSISEPELCNPMPSFSVYWPMSLEPDNPIAVGFLVSTLRGVTHLHSHNSHLSNDPESVKTNTVTTQQCL